MKGPDMINIVEGTMPENEQKTTAEKMDIIDFGPIEDTSRNIIKVIGVGGGGGNAVSNMFQEGIEGVSFAICNTDSQALAHCNVPVKVLLGKTGLGAGGNPEVGRSEAEYNISDVERLLDDGTQMVFVTAGMGGGTGTGAAPVVAAAAKKRGILTVGVVTIPFFFEKRNKIISALKGVEELRKHVDALLIVNNERLCDIYSDSDLSLKESFKRADHILSDAVKSISELITVYSEGSVNLDFRDVETTTREGGGAIMAMGRASGAHRVENAIKDALDSPLIYGNDISKAKRILFNIYSSDEDPIRVKEMSEVDEFFNKLNPEIDVIWGTATDNTLEKDVKVTILATGISNSLCDDNSEEVKIVGPDYDSIIKQLYHPIKKTAVEEEPPLIINEPEPVEPAVAEPEQGEVSEQVDVPEQVEVTEQEKEPVTTEPEVAVTEIEEKEPEVEVEPEPESEEEPEEEPEEEESEDEPEEEEKEPELTPADGKEEKKTEVTPAAPKSRWEIMRERLKKKLLETMTEE